MFNPTQVMIHACVEELRASYRQTYGSLKPDYADLLGWVANMALEIIANSDALYHNVEHAVLVTLTGQEVLRGKHICSGGVSCEDWLHFIISLLCHDIGYVKGICRDDRAEERLYATGLDEMMIKLPFGATDASLTPFHVDRGKLFVEERLGNRLLIDAQTVKGNIEKGIGRRLVTKFYKAALVHPVKLLLYIDLRKILPIPFHRLGNSQF